MPRTPPAPQDRPANQQHRETTLAELRHAAEHSPLDTALRLLVHAWIPPPTTTDHAWCRQVYDIGRRLLHRAPDSLALATAFHHGAHALRTAGLPHLAIGHDILELAVHRHRDDNPDDTATVLTELAHTHHEHGLLGEAADCLDEALETHLRHHHQPGVARTLLALGAILLESGRPEDALDHLHRADKTYQDLPDAPDHLLLHAETLALTAQAARLTGDFAAATHYLNRAVATALRLDNTTIRQIRALTAGTRPWRTTTS